MLTDNHAMNTPLSAVDKVWQQIRDETAEEVQREPVLASFLHATILNHDALEDALSFHLAQMLASPAASALLVREVIDKAFAADAEIRRALRADLCAVLERDSACSRLSVPFLYFKGYHALQSYRVSHWLWQHERRSLALFFQNRISGEFGVDIHPAAKVGRGVMMDHATGIVIGETAEVGNNVSLMQSVTLGGTGKEHGDRHPKVADGVLISAGAKILGNIRIGEGSHVVAGSVVLKEVPPHSLVAGVPAKVIGSPDCDAPALSMNHSACCDD